MKLLKRFLIGLAIAVGLLVVYLLTWPVSIDPVAWTPPKAPELTGVYQANSCLASVERLGEGAGIGPETIAMDGQGRIYSGVEDGRILRLQPEGSKPEVFADTGGRPVGLCFDASGNLVVCDAYKGLLLITPEGSIRVLTTESNGVPFRLTDGVDIAADGTIYFSDASCKFTYAEYMLDFMEHRPRGLFFDRFEKEFGSTRSKEVVKHQYGRYYDFLNPEEQKLFMVESQKSGKCMEVVKKAVLIAGDIILENS